jgi:beta-glucanase (GH16 family)
MKTSLCLFISLVQIKRSFSSLAVGALLLGLLGGGTSAAYGDWTNVWSDDFNGTSVDTTKWAFESGNNGGWGNNELEFYTSRTNNAYVANGALHIRAQIENTNSGGTTYRYTSARMKTQGKFSKTYGMIEFRAKLPQGTGFWPALWGLGTNIASPGVGWPACGELDIMENKGTDPITIGGTIHYNNAGNPNGDIYQTKSYNLPTPGDSVTNFHTYAIQWSSNSIIWMVDGTPVQTWTSWTSSLGPFPAPFDRPFYLLMNLAVGGNYVGNPDTNSINPSMPGEMQVDYVHVFDYVAPVTPPTTPTGLTATAGGAQVMLNWSNSPSATSYNVKRSATSGGSYTTIGNPTGNSYTDTGVVSCATYYYVVSATNSLGESANSGEASATLGSYALAVNSGGSAVGQFIADANVTGGTIAAPTGSAIDTTAVTNPAPQAVYQTERYGTFTYTFGGLTTGTAYKVRLHEAEIYFNAANSRKFNVTINGTQVLTNFDIFAAAGSQNKAVIREFIITPNGSGQIIIAYTVGTADLPKSSGIEIILPSPTAPTGLGATPGDAQVALTWNTVAGAASYNVKRATSGVGPFNAVTNGITGVAYTDTGLINGTNYYYAISTVRGGCESTNSVAVSATPVSALTPFQQWQVQYFGSTNNPSAAPDADANGTGQNNQFKYVAGLDPTNPASVFVLTVSSVAGQPTQMNLVFRPLATGRTYTPQSSTDLVSGVWTQLPSYAGPVTNGNQVTITDLNAVESNKFYLIDISLP